MSEEMRAFDEDVLADLKASNAILSGHFALTSGKHSDTYVQCARVLEDPNLTMDLARKAVAKLPSGLEIDLVISPAVGGIIFGFAVALALGKRFIFAEREKGAMTLRRAFNIDPGSKALIVEDVVTTGGSVAEVARIVTGSGAEVVGIVSLIDRGQSHVFSDPFYPLLTLDIASWDPDSCELCAKGTPLYAPGSRKLNRG